MATTQSVFAAPSNPLPVLEAAIEQYPLAVGPFTEADETRLRDFLTQELPALRAASQKSGQGLRLYLQPHTIGWLAEIIRALSNSGLNHYCFEGLILSTSDYPGNMSHLYAEANEFAGPKFLWYSKPSGAYSEQFLREVRPDNWAGMYASVEGGEESDYYNQTIALLRIARRVVHLQLPIWVSRFSTESLRCNTVLLGSQGFYVDTHEP